MTTLSTDTKQFEQDLAKLLSSTVDVSLRDGDQALYATAWKKDDLVAVAKQYGVLAEMLVTEYEQERPIMETWGGTIPERSANLHGEHCSAFAEAYAEVMPYVTQRDLNRGAAGYALTTQPKDIRTKLVQGALDAGIGITRVFDCMGDPDNIKHTADAANKYKSKHPDAQVEVAVCYTGGETDKEIRVRDVQDYINEGIDLVKNCKADRLAFKDYGGFAPQEEMVAIVKGWREELGPDFPITVHSHGDRAEELAACLEAGGENTFVDTAMGKLSGTASHTNVMDLIKETLGKTYDLTSPDIAESPLAQQLGKIEQTINLYAGLYESKRANPSDAVQKALKTGLIAGGGTQATLNAAEGFYNEYKRLATKDGNETPATKDKFIIYAMEECAPQLWEAAGRFDTVTPGTKAMGDASFVMAAYALAGKPVQLSKLPFVKQMQPYKDIVMGRLGHNRGFDKGIGNTAMRDMFLVEDMLNTLKDSDFHGKKGLRDTLLQAANLSEDIIALTMDKDGNIRGNEDLNMANLKSTLTNELTFVPDALKAELLTHLDIGMIDMADGKDILSGAKAYAQERSREGIDEKTAHYDYLCLGDVDAKRLAIKQQQPEELHADNSLKLWFDANGTSPSHFSRSAQTIKKTLIPQNTDAAVAKSFWEHMEEKAKDARATFKPSEALPSWQEHMRSSARAPASPDKKPEKEHKVTTPLRPSEAAPVTSKFKTGGWGHAVSELGNSKQQDRAS